ncbi:unnamed protein product [Chrysoparadoxa australica]
MGCTVSSEKGLPPTSQEEADRDFEEFSKHMNSERQQQSGLRGGSLGSTSKRPRRMSGKLRRGSPGKSDSAHGKGLAREDSNANGNGAALSPRVTRQRSTYNAIHELVHEKIAVNGGQNGLVGLANLGNTCFMNTAIQCLSNCVPFTDYFLGYAWKDEMNTTNLLGHGGKLVSAYGKLIQEIWSTLEPEISPSQFKEVVGTLMPQFRGYAQHDVQEFLSFLLDAVHEDLNRVDSKPYVEDVEGDGKKSDERVAMEAWEGYLKRNKSVVVDLMQGQLRSTLTCKTCKFRRVKFDPFMYLSVPVSALEKKQRSITLEGCIELFCEEENLDSDESWFCPKCKDFRPASKKLDLWKLPATLIIHLKRFECSRSGKRSKINDLIEFPLDNLDLSKMVKSPQKDAPDYDLFAVANHHGTLYGGHYTAFVRSRINNDWYLCNDDRVKAVSAKEVHSTAAYVLFFQKMVNDDDDNSSFSEPPKRKQHVVRRQSVSKPEAWPHVLQQIEPSGGVPTPSSRVGGGAPTRSPSARRTSSRIRQQKEKQQQQQQQQLPHETGPGPVNRELQFDSNKAEQEGKTRRKQSAKARKR